MQTNVPSDVQTTLRPSPYVGPRSFRQGEKLYGRERETTALLDLLIAERIILLYSPSGAGKSSLIQAALLPGLAEQGFTLLPTIRVNQEPPAELAGQKQLNRYVWSALLSLEENRPADRRIVAEELACLTLDEYLQRRCTEDETQESIVLIFDQFEEVLNIDPTNREAKTEFFLQLGQSLRDRSRWALFSMREDYIAALDPYLRPVPTRLSNRFRLDLLEAEGAMQAIRQPPRSVGVEFDEEAARRLVDDLRQVTIQQPDGTLQALPGLYVEPVQLQVVCSKLWEDLPNDGNEISLENVEAIGDTNRALADYYDHQLRLVCEETGISERVIRKWFDRQLITVQGIRGQVLLGAQETEGLPNRAVRLLEKAYLVRAEKRGGVTWFELAHDRLIQPVRGSNAAWFTKNLAALQQQAEVWQERGRPDGMLLTGSALEEAETWAAANAAEMTDIEKAYLEEALHAREALLKEKQYTRRIRILAIGALVVGVVALIAGIVASSLFLEARRQATISRAREISFISLNNMTIDPERSILLALEAIELTGGPENALPSAIDALHRSFQYNYTQRTLLGHQDRVYASAYSHDGNRLVTASKDGTVRVWDAKTGKELQVLAHPNKVAFSDVAYSPDGRYFAASAGDASVYVWDANNLSQVMKLTDGEGFVWGVAFSPDGKRLASAHEDGVARLWSLETKQVLEWFDTGSQEALENVAFSPDGMLLAATGDNWNTYVWNLETGEVQFVLEGHQDKVNNVEFSSDGALIATASADRTIGIWNGEDGTLIRMLEGHRDWVYRSAFVYDDQYLLSAGADRVLRLWDLEGGFPIAEYYGHTNQVFDLAIHPDGYHVASTSQDGTVRIWDITAAGSYELFTRSTSGSVHALDQTPDGKQLAFVIPDSGIQIWDIDQEAPRLVIASGTHIIEDVAYSPDGKQLVSVSQDGELRFYETDTYKTRKTVQKDQIIWAIAFSSDSKRLLIGYDDGTIAVLDAQEGQDQIVLPFPTEANLYTKALAVDLHPAGRFAAAGYQDGTVIVWDLQQKKPAVVLQAQHSDGVQAVQFSPDGRLLASVGEDARVFLMDFSLPDGKVTVRKPIEKHSGALFAMDFSPDSQLLATAGADLTTYLWKTATGEESLALYGHSNRIDDIQFGPDGKSLITGGQDRTVRGYLLDPSDLVKLAKERVHRSLTEQECQLYLSLDRCP